MPIEMIKTSIEIDLEIEVEYGYEDDDDGCGSPSITGNHMTGCRGRYPVIISAKIADPEDFLAEAENYIDEIKNDFVDDI